MRLVVMIKRCRGIGARREGVARGGASSGDGFDESPSPAILVHHCCREMVDELPLDKRQGSAESAVWWGCEVGRAEAKIQSEMHGKACQVPSLGQSQFLSVNRLKA